MKKFLIFLFIFSIKIFPQLEYVPIDHKVYDFLERMGYNHIIENYNSFEKPKPRREIASCLAEIIKKADKLSALDREILGRYKDEFEFDISGSLDKSSRMFSGNEKYELFGNKEKYLYYLSDSSKINLFLSFVGSGEAIYSNNRIAGNSINAGLVQYGGVLRGTVLNKMGFYFQATNGFYVGDRDAAILNKDVKQNYKFNEMGKGSYFDQTTGYVTADFDLLRVKFGRDRLQVGYGALSPLIDDNSAPVNYLSFDIKYKFLSFSYFHGKILGNSYYAPDTVFGNVQVIPEKYVGYHRFGINFSEDFTLGLGEIIIYANRPPDFSYINPFAFYKSIEHANQDRDNSMLFFDFTNNTIKGLKFYSTLLLDDMSFDKIGKGWYGNQTLWNFGVHTSVLDKYMPVDFSVEYLRIEPYVFTHHVPNNNYTNFGVPLSSNAQPNSELIFSQFNYRLKYNLSVSVKLSYGRHGANPLNEDGSVKENVGGDINLGHRINDGENVKFLDGFIEYKRSAGISLFYEPYYDISLNLNLVYFNNSLLKNIKEENIQTFFTLSAKL
jgi:hypothetical protein